MAYKGQTLLESEQIDGLLDAAGVDGVREIMAAFWRSSDALASGLSNLLDDEDAGGALKTAHALKGSAANVGAAKLAECAKHIEARCRAGDLASAREALAALIGIYEETRSAVESHLAAKSA